MPFGTLIGGPLKACIEAQTDSAMATWKFIKEVGLVDDGNGNRSLTYVSFTYRKNGREATINVPLLTIVPIPYIAIRDIDIAFKASISAASSTSTSTKESLAFDFGMKSKVSANALIAKASVEMNVGVSSKKDSTATRDSKYSVEYTMDVAVKAGQDDMPAGMAKVLEMLNESIDTVDKGGELHLSSSVVDLSSNNDGMKGVYITYKNEQGYFENTKTDMVEIKMIKDGREQKAVKGTDYEITPDDPGFICLFNTPGRYTVAVGEKTAQVQVINS